MLVAHPFQIGPELLYQPRVVKQDRSPSATFSHDRQVLIVEREVKILHIQGKPLADPQASLREQTEEEPITQTPGGNNFENALNLGALHSTRLRRIEFHRVDLAHGVTVEQIVLLSPSQKTCYRCLLTRPGCWTKMAMPSKECSQHLCGDRLHWPLMKGTQLR